MAGTTVKIETHANAQRVTVTVAAAGTAFDAAGVAAVLGALNTHYSGLSAPNQAAVAALAAATAPPRWVIVRPTQIDAAILAASLATVAAAISTALTGAGYTCSTVAYTGD